MSRFAIACACGWSLMAAGCAGPRQALNDDEAIRVLKISPLVFDATIVKRHEVPPSLAEEKERAEKRLERTNFVLARVDAVHVDSDVRALRPGKQVWIALQPTTDPDKLENATWYTQLWMSGNGLIVCEIGHETALRTTEQIKGFEGRIHEESLKEQLKKAQQVVVADVESVHPLAGDGKRKSEHDPKWNVAVVRAKPLKGTLDRGQIDVQFATSDDIAWRRAPRLKPGDNAILILRSNGADAAFRVTDSANVRPMSDLPLIEKLLRELTAKK